MRCCVRVMVVAAPPSNSVLRAALSCHKRGNAVQGWVGATHTVRAIRRSPARSGAIYAIRRGPMRTDATHAIRRDPAQSSAVRRGPMRCDADRCCPAQSIRHTAGRVLGTRVRACFLPSSPASQTPARSRNSGNRSRRPSWRFALVGVQSGVRRGDPAAALNWNVAPGRTSE